jgi:uncharacterized membrane protein
MGIAPNHEASWGTAIQDCARTAACRRGALLCGRALLFRTIGLRVETLGDSCWLLATTRKLQQQQQRLVSYDPPVPPGAAVLAGYALGNPCVLSSEVTVIPGSSASTGR